MAYKLKLVNNRHSVSSGRDWISGLGLMIMWIIVAITLYLIWNKANLQF